MVSSSSATHACQPVQEDSGAFRVVEGRDQIDQHEGRQEDPLHLAQDTRPQRRTEFKVKGRAQRQRTCQERKEKQGT